MSHTPAPLPSGLLRAAPEAVGLCPERTARLLATFQAEIDARQLPGAVVLVARRGKVALFESLGAQDPQRGTPMALDSIFRIYSMTKPIVSVAIMMLMEQGRLLLSDPVAKYLPEFAHQHVAEVQDAGKKGKHKGHSKIKLRAARRAATVQDLLRHTAGLTYEFLGAADVQQQYAAAQMGGRHRSNAEFSSALAAMPLLVDPGSAWEYSRATDVLGRLVEVLTGQTLGGFLQSEILAPLGMIDTAFAVPSGQHSRIAEAFEQDPNGAAPFKMINIRQVPALESGGGGLASTAADYARFLQFMLNRGELDGVRLLGPKTVDYMTADHLGDTPIYPHSLSSVVLPPGHGFGLGFAVRTAAGVASVPGSAGQYFWGGIAGTSFFVDPALDLFAVMMIQAPNQRDYYRQLFRNLVYAALLD